MNSFSDSPIDEVAREMLWERALKRKASQRYQLGVNVSRVMKLRQIMANIERTLKKKEPYPLDKARTFIENYETYPEVRPLAEKVLPKIIDVDPVHSKRLATYNRLLKKMREFQH